MLDQLSALYSSLPEGSYDGVHRVVLNAYFGMGQTGGGLRVWWRELYGSDADLDDNHLMRMAGRFSRRLRACYTWQSFQRLEESVPGSSSLSDANHNCGCRRG
jgi:hypothetical protein